MTEELEFRIAKENDVEKILYFIKELADYENLLHEVVATKELLQEWIFEKQKAEVLFAVRDGKEIGFALFFHNFSTFLGRAGLYLEDLFVLPQYRGKGYGKPFLNSLLELRKRGAVDVWSGGAWIGISPALTSTCLLVHKPWMNGRFIA